MRVARGINRDDRAVFGIDHHEGCAHAVGDIFSGGTALFLFIGGNLSFQFAHAIVQCLQGWRGADGMDAPDTG